MSMPALSLAHLTVLEVGPPELIDLAADAGFRAVGLRLVSPMAGGIEYPLKAGSAGLREMCRRMQERGVQVSDIEVVRLAADTDVTAYAAVFEAGAELGARRVCINVDDPVRTRVIERFAALCDLAAPFGLSLDVEFMIWRPVARLQDAVEIVASAAPPNGFVLVDALHLTRSGGDAAAVAAIDRRLIGSVQLCDAPLRSPPPEAIVDEARGARLLPGEGELPLLALLAALPDEVPLAVEAPMSALHPELGPLRRATLAYEATTRLLQRRTRRD